MTSDEKPRAALRDRVRDRWRKRQEKAAVGEEKRMDGEEEVAVTDISPPQLTGTHCPIAVRFGNTTASVMGVVEFVSDTEYKFTPLFTGNRSQVRVRYQRELERWVTKGKL